VTRRERLANGLDKALLGMLMLSLAFVLEKALDRMVEDKPERERSQLGRRLFRRMVPSHSAHIEHRPHQAAPE